MPKLKHPDTGRIVSVSRQGVEALKARGYTDPADDTTATAPVASGQTPARSASKAEWVDYAATQGIENADSLTKAELVDRLGGE